MLLQPPAPDTARDEACRHLASSLPTPLVPAQLGEQLRSLLESQQAEASKLEQQVADSTAKTERLVAETRTRSARIRERSRALKDSHGELGRGLEQARDKLTSGLESKDPEGDGLTLRERLVALSDRRQQLVAAQKWFGAVARAEEHGYAALQWLARDSTSERTDSKRGQVDRPPVARGQLAAASIPSLRRARQLCQSDRWRGVGGQGCESDEHQWSGCTHLAARRHGHVCLERSRQDPVEASRNVLLAFRTGTMLTSREKNSRLLEKLETLGWPQPFAEALDPYEDNRVAEFQTAFVDLLTLEHLCVICSRLPNVQRLT